MQTLWQDLRFGGRMLLKQPGLTLIAVTVVVYAFLTFAYISFFCFLAGLGTLHLIYIIVRNKCCRECPEIFR